MIDHRQLQRALLRMQLDDDYAERLLSGDEEAVAASGLRADELALLATVDSRAISADRAGARQGQVLGNASRELELTTASARVLHPRARFLEDFSRSSELHEALATDGRLPIAYADYAVRRAAELGDALLAGLAALESTMVRARRAQRPAPAPAAGELVLSPAAWLCTLPDGLFAHAQHLRTVLNGGATTLPDAPRFPTATETVLVLARPRENPHRLPELHVERLEPAVAELLTAAREPLDAPARATLAARMGAEAADLESFADELVSEGALLRG